eukprot:scaffold22957_cov58-Phaeocystis_antarctica.AAC.2
MVLTSACHRLRTPRTQHAPPVYTLRRQVPRREAARAYAGRALEITDVHAPHHPRRTQPCRPWPLRCRAGGDRARGRERRARRAKLAVENERAVSSVLNNLHTALTEIRHFLQTDPRLPPRRATPSKCQ